MTVESVNDASLEYEFDIPKHFSSQKKAKKLAWDDIGSGIYQWRIWLLLAYQDIKLRYRRSALGPFWITLSMAITVYSMGFLYGHLFRTDLREYYPFLAAGLLSWAFISTSIMDLSDAFITSDDLIKQIKLPYTLYIHRVIARNIIIFFHNIIVMIPIIIFYPTASISFFSLLLIPNLILLYINALFYGLILAIIGARYRDMSQMIKSLIQVIFFVTPIIWNPIILPHQYQLLAYCNPFYAFVQLIRAPLVGVSPSLWVYGIASFFTMLGAFISWKLLVKYRSRIVYWL